MNIINIEITPTIGQSFRWLLRSGEAFSRNGLFTFSIPLTVTLFSGDIRAAIKIAFIFFELKLEWIIHSFSGFKLLGIDLYKLEVPLLEDY